MDYMKQELDRQRAALMALLTGGDRREKRQGEEQARPADGDAFPGESAAEPAAFRPGRALGDRGEGMRAAFSAGNGRELPEEELFRGDGPFPGAARQAGPGPENRGAGSPESRQRVPERSEALSRAAPPEGAGPRMRVVTEVVELAPDTAALTDARALSLAVQRDARRYDGGFSLY